MGIVVPTEFKQLTLKNYATGEDAEAGEWTTLIEDLHYLWSVKIALLDGHVFDPPFTVGSTTYVGGATLSDGDAPEGFRMASRLRRLVGDTVDAPSEIIVSGRVFIEQADLRWTVTRLDDDRTTHQIAQSDVSEANGTPEWKELEFTLSEATVSNNGNASNAAQPIFHDIEIRTDADGNTAKLYQADGFEAVATASQVPTTT